MPVTSFSNPTQLGPIQLKNAFIKAATYEGMSKDGVISDQLIDFHANLAKGGVGLTTVSYGAVSNEARTFADQMKIDETIAESLKVLADKVHENGGKISMQLTHCGYFSKNKSISKPLSASRVFNAYGSMVGLAFSKAMDKQDLAKTLKDFVRAAKIVQIAGFDAVEIHMGHGYLLSQFLSPETNKRKDEYGGSIENRYRYPTEVLKAVKAAIGKEMAVTVKLNLSDGFKGGFTLEDFIATTKALLANGCDLVQLSGGFTSKTPFYLMRGDLPLKGMIANAKSFAEKWTMRLFGPMIVKKYPFEPRFFFNQALEVQKEVGEKLCYLGGVDSIEDVQLIEEAGFDTVGLARPLIHDAAFVNKLLSGAIQKSACTRCNQCVVEMDRGGVKCVEADFQNESECEHEV